MKGRRKDASARLSDLSEGVDAAKPVEDGVQVANDGVRSKAPISLTNVKFGLLTKCVLPPYMAVGQALYPHILGRFTGLSKLQLNTTQVYQILFADTRPLGTNWDWYLGTI